MTQLEVFHFTISYFSKPCGSLFFVVSAFSSFLFLSEYSIVPRCTCMHAILHVHVHVCVYIHTKRQKQDLPKVVPS